MSDGIMDNQTVTTTDLNDIAKALGATSFNGFTTNKFGAAELNGITKALVSKGVLMTGNRCQPTSSGGKVYIQTGTIIFESGARKTITEAVETELLPGTHIYAYTDGVSAYIRQTDTLPESGDYVRLASVDANGNLADNREFSKGKALSGTANTVVTLTKTITAYGAKRSDKQSYTFDVGFGGFGYILWTQELSYNTDCFAAIDDNTSAIVAYNSDKTLTVTKNGTNIIVSGEYKGHPNATESVTFTITLV